jgi:hypothetical protein
MSSFQIGSTDKARAFEGVLSEVVIYSTALKEDQVAMLQKDIFEQYLQVPKPKPLAERTTIKKPFYERGKWKFAASHNNNPNETKKVADGDTGSNWTTNTGQHSNMWFTVELGEPLKMGGVILDSAISPGDYPRQWEVQLSDDGKAWRSISTGKNDIAVLAISFPKPETASWVRIKQTGSASNHWRISELVIFAP